MISVQVTVLPTMSPDPPFWLRQTKAHRSGAFTVKLAVTPLTVKLVGPSPLTSQRPNNSNYRLPIGWKTNSGVGSVGAK